MPQVGEYDLEELGKYDSNCLARQNSIIWVEAPAELLDMIKPIRMPV